MATQLTATSIATSVLTSSNAASKLGLAISKLDQEIKLAHLALNELAEEVRFLSNQCDLLHAELQKAAATDTTEPSPPSDIVARTWICFAAQVEEIHGTIHEGERLIETFKENYPGSPKYRWDPSQSKDQIVTITSHVCRHTNSLRTSVLITDMCVPLSL